MNLHPITRLFPPMAAEDFRALVADIKENGLREPVWTYRGEIIDGAHRHAACKELGIELRTREWGGSGSLTAFVISLNLRRRHLSQSEKATIAVEALPLFEGEARDRQRATLKQGDRKPVRAELPQREARARDDAAKAVGVSPRYVQDAKKLKREAPEAFEEVRAGKQKLSRALASIRPAPLTETEQIARRVRHGVARLREWRASYGDLPPFKRLVALIDQLVTENAA